MQNEHEGPEGERTTELADPRHTVGDGPPAPPVAVAEPDPAWWTRPAVLAVAAAVAGLGAGLGAGLVIGLNGGDQNLEVAAAAATEAEAERDELRTDLDTAQARIEQLEAAVQRRSGAIVDRENELSRLETELADTQAQRDRAVEAAREELEEERNEVLSQAQAALDEREAALDERAEDLDVAEERQAASTFGNGVHIVGTDIEPGLYRTEGGSNCYWARLSGLSGGFGDLITNGLPDGPASIEIQGSDAGFESSGCATWNRVD